MIRRNPCQAPLHARRGQTVVLFVVAAIATFAFVGLLLDASNLYRNRRLLQNAADAAALAGARIAAESGKTNAQVLAAIEAYAADNLSDCNVAAYYVSSESQLDAVDSYGEADPVPSNAAGVHVTCTKSIGAIFAFLWRAASTRVTAHAIGIFGPCQCAPADSNIFPVAIEDDVLQDISVGDEIYIWDSDKVTDGDGTELGGNRGWLNLDFVYSQDDPNGRTVSKSHSNAKLKQWAQYGKSPAITLYSGHVGEMDGDFINGDPGTRTSAIQKAGTRIGDRVLIPIYDTAYTKSDMQAQADFTTPDIGWASNSYYHIVGFAEFTIAEVSATGHSKWIRGCFVTPSVLDCSTAAPNGDGETGDDDDAVADNRGSTPGLVPVVAGDAFERGYLPLSGSAILFVSHGHGHGDDDDDACDDDDCCHGDDDDCCHGDDDDAVGDDDDTGDDDDDAVGDDDDTGDDDDDGGTGETFQSDELSRCVSLVDTIGGVELPAASDSGDDDDSE